MLRTVSLLFLCLPLSLLAETSAPVSLESLAKGKGGAAQLGTPLSPHFRSSKVGKFIGDQSPTSSSRYRGWDFLVSKLKKEKIDTAYLESVYSSLEMPLFTPVTYKLKPKESKQLYTGFTNKKKLNKAILFLQKHKNSFHTAQSTYGVSPFVICSILLIETHLGTNTGRHLIVNRLSRLASISEPNNMRHNLALLQKDDESVTFAQVKQRGLKLHEMFYPEVVALFSLASERGVDLLSFKGSISGAFGLPQFLPTTYFRFGTDGNEDGEVSLFHPDDAIASIGNFLSGFGWKDSLSRSEKEKVVWNYNHSQAYVDTVLNVAELLKKM